MALPPWPNSSTLSPRRNVSTSRSASRWMRSACSATNFSFVSALSSNQRRIWGFTIPSVGALIVGEGPQAVKECAPSVPRPLWGRGAGEGARHWADSPVECYSDDHGQDRAGRADRRNQPQGVPRLLDPGEARGGDRGQEYGEQVAPQGASQRQGQLRQCGPR